MSKKRSSLLVLTLNLSHVRDLASNPELANENCVYMLFCLLKNDANKDTTIESNIIKRFNKLTLRNKDVLDGSWMDRIVWDPNQSVTKPKLLLDLQDEQMLFEILDNKHGDDLQLHAGAMITTRSAESAPDSLELLHGYGWGRFNIANEKFYSNRKSSQQLKSHSKKCTSHGVKFLHSIPALKLQTMKAKLSNKDIAYFHRPKALWYPHENLVALKEQGKLLTKGSMEIVLKSLGGKGSKLHVDAEETVLSLKGKAIFDILTVCFYIYVINHQRGSFAGDLENLLDAEECDEDEEDNNNYDSNNLVAGVKGLKMRRMPSQAQADVENKDEAAELCRMLMDGIS
ncbi:transcription initiation factor TFIID subunit 1-like [Lactuca sativa]|uniref:transcription initiation factor TFIID subunit 1-like n=1 Tax=Lactuca sativa TaxID=4236 RepID=UPI0022AEAD82|nr:transcription initiation factor TFIID subunit 1-like [Lactuca sativa]